MNEEQMQEHLKASLKKMEAKRVARSLANSIQNIKEALAIIESVIETDKGSCEMQLRRLENSAKTIRNLRPGF
jgi:hypothetical protein